MWVQYFCVWLAGGLASFSPKPHHWFNFFQNLPTSICAKSDWNKTCGLQSVGYKKDQTRSFSRGDGGKRNQVAFHFHFSQPKRAGTVEPSKLIALSCWSWKQSFDKKQQETTVENNCINAPKVESFGGGLLVPYEDCHVPTKFGKTVWCIWSDTGDTSVHGEMWIWRDNHSLVIHFLRFSSWWSFICVDFNQKWCVLFRCWRMSKDLNSVYEWLLEAKWLKMTPVFEWGKRPSFGGLSPKTEDKRIPGLYKSQLVEILLPGTSYRVPGLGE